MTAPSSSARNGIPFDAAAWLSASRARVERELSSVLDERLKGAPAELAEAMRYAAAGGKRLRALLVYASADLFGGSDSSPDSQTTTAGAAACAVELIHAYSLVHDDLPCMDNDLMRRGQPSCHAKFGEALAMLAGDALQALAFETLASGATFPDERTGAAMLALLAQAAGAAGMCGGQVLDMLSENENGKTMLAQRLPALERMHRLKTGALITASTLLGAMSGDKLLSDQDRALLTRFGETIGLAFQVADDILDATAASETLGKTAGKDAEQHKTTYATLLGIGEAKTKLETLRQTAHSLLTPFGDRALPLSALVDQMTVRSY